MLVVETIAKIRRAFFKQGKAIKAICRELGVSRKVVRKVIRSGVTEFRFFSKRLPLFWSLTLSQAYPGPTAVLIDEFHTCLCENTLDHCQ